MTRQMWRVVALYRVVTLLYAGVLIVQDDKGYAHPWAGYAALGVMAGWTVITIAGYSRLSGWKCSWLVAADLAVAVVLTLATRWVVSPARADAGAGTLPTFWAAAPVLACAVAGGPWVGLAGALVLGGVDGAERQTFTAPALVHGIVTLLLAGGIGGFVMRLGRKAEEAGARAARREAVLTERERIARGIHDSVLQVLSLVASRGSALGGEAAELGRLAAGQEAALRSLVSGDGLEPLAPGDGLGAGRCRCRDPADVLGGGAGAGVRGGWRALGGPFGRAGTGGLGRC